MSPRNTPRITPAQVFALILIWGGVVYGVSARQPASPTQTQVAQLTACR